MKTQKSNYGKLWTGIGILMFLAPMGLILPELFRAGGAWGEWGVEEIRDIAGYVPGGLKHISEVWSAPIPDYAFSGWNKGVKSYIAYLASGLVGIVIVVAVSYVLGKVLKRENDDRVQ
ncbi:MAG: cobalamin biosynthesis protein [Nitrospirae bacterium]|nr:cobalamin biosynthesis protein [Nitrospirota bacterium]